ncbi:MAG: PH domain-containing protein [Chloroflexi bacterium]|nr:PH domain-containing protein [Chloroflexota bacterium]
MYSRQNVVLQSVVSITGLTVAGFSLFAIASNVLIAARLDLLMRASEEQIIRSIAFISLFTYIGYLGMIFATLFPRIRVTESGLDVKYTFYVRLIPWDEIKGITHAKWPNGATAIIISPNGNIFSAFFMYYPQRLHGLITRVFEPAIIVTNEMENREKLLSEIKFNTSQQNKQQL